MKANFWDAYITELTRVKKGFVDIPVGDFMTSKFLTYLKILFFTFMALPEFVFQDLCVSKAFALHLLGFQEEATRIVAYGLAGWCCCCLWQSHLLRKYGASNVDSNKMCETARDFQL